MIRIVLAENHPITLQGMTDLIENEKDMKLVGTATTGIDVLRIVDKCSPDILITDLMMSGLDGFEVTRQVVARYPKIGVLVFSRHSEEEYVIQALKYGARGYVIKDSHSSCLIDGIRAVYEGNSYLSPPLSDRELNLYAKLRSSTAIDPVEYLTTREREILQLTAQGHTSSQIAGMLGISSRTVEAHRASLMQKLNLSNQSEVIRFALRHAIISLED